ncbi:hypothetical protein I5M27_15705 [Adhaeribacter sp. BT258]|uniref:Metal-dependent HD superfamily phosphohydrolase n=1 Tax=Adhaeribacter terrigena TaxID=2793070 RepID=A0ABS1C516_9BACT|nr:hypothetical protein [Adhaeribacter terrigena]MBK0404444.1 hypothetical protein [Adhaeribacter terrigena]
MKNPELNPKQEWKELAGRFTKNLNLVRRLWHDLEVYYSSPDRHYHNLDHIQELLQLAAENRDKFSLYDEIRFAIFYHDAIYDPNSTNNEEKSAHLAVLSLEDLDLNRQQLHFITEAILATKKHEQHSDSDINLLMDLDLHILASDWEKYDQYRQQIRKEYSLFPDLLYKPGRKKILQQLLDQPRIYKTDSFYQLYEEAARKNLQRELSDL